MLVAEFQARARLGGVSGAVAADRPGPRSKPPGTAELLCALSYGSGLAAAADGTRDQHRLRGRPARASARGGSRGPVDGADKGELFTSRRQVYHVLTWRNARRSADLGTYWAGSSAQANRTPPNHRPHALTRAPRMGSGAWPSARADPSCAQARPSQALSTADPAVSCAR